MPKDQRAPWIAAKIIFTLLALTCFAFAGVIAFWTVPESRALRDKRLKSPNLSSRKDLTGPAGADLSATGFLHREGATPGDYIVYVRHRIETTRRGGETNRRWILEENVRPSVLELRMQDVSLRLVSEVEEYSFVSPSVGRSSDSSTSGFKEGQEVTCFGVLRSPGTGQDPPTFAFREIWGEGWPAIQKQLEEGYWGIPTEVPILVLVGSLFMGMVVLILIAEKRARASG